MLCCRFRHLSLLHPWVALQADPAAVTTSMQQATGSTTAQLVASGTTRQHTSGARQSPSATGAADRSQVVTPRTTARSRRKAHVEELSQRVHAKPVALRQQIRLQAQQQVSRSLRCPTACRMPTGTAAGESKLLHSGHAECYGCLLSFLSLRFFALCR